MAEMIVVEEIPVGALELTAKIIGSESASQRALDEGKKCKDPVYLKHGDTIIVMEREDLIKRNNQCKKMLQ